MGVFGVNNFDNDAALDWLAQLEEAKGSSSKFIEAAVRGGLENWETLLAGAEVVAALFGHPAKKLPVELTLWLSKNQPKLSDSLREETFLAVKVAKENPDLAKQWVDSSDQKKWAAAQNNLLKRLKAAPQSLTIDEKVLKRAMRREEPVVFFSRVWSHDFGSQTPLVVSRLAEYPLTSELAHTHSVTLDLSDKFSLGELKSVASFLQSAPRVFVNLMDREGRVGEEEVSKVLSVFAHRKRMKFSFKKLPLEKILDVYSHVSALQLVSKEAFDISGLASLKNLEGLSLSGEVKGASVLNDLNLGVLSLTRVTFEQNALPSLPHCLKGLSIEDCKFADVTQLRRAHKLKVCKLSNFDAGIGGLAALPIEHMALKFVALSEKCELPSDLRTLSLVHLLAGSVLSPLAKLKLLEELEVSYCFNLTDASPLGSLASLRQLALGGPQFPLSSVGFGGLQRLRDMELSTFPEERSEELGSLSECAALTHLFLPNSELVKNGKELLEGLKISEGALPSSRLKEALMPLVSLEPDRI